MTKTQRLRKVLDLLVEAVGLTETEFGWSDLTEAINDSRTEALDLLEQGPLPLEG